MSEAIEPISKKDLLEGAPNGVQALGAIPLEHLKKEAIRSNQRFFEVQLESASNKKQVLECIAKSFNFPSYFGHNLDALAECLTDFEMEEGQAGFVVMLERVPSTPEFDGNERKKLLEVFHDVAEFWADQSVPFRVFYSFE